MSEKRTKPGSVIAAVNGVWISYAHTAFAATAFISALFLGITFHFHKIVKNEYYGYPDEWFPSVSATIGDRYPERNVFQIFIALTAGPRFALVFLFYLLTAKPGAFPPKILAVVGLLRTFVCGGWVYITSTDDHDWHDIFMIAYLILTLPWTIGAITLTKNPVSLQYRKFFGISFFVMLIPLVYFFIQHKVQHVPGAYTIYSFFEWSLIFFDLAFDSVTAVDFSAFEIKIFDLNGVTARSSVASSSTNHASIREGNLAGFTVSGFLSFLVSIYNSFIFWTSLTSLGLLIWYFPLWYMGISGYEATLVGTLAPIFLGIPFIAKLFIRFPQLAQLGQLASIAAYLVPGPSDRLLTVTVGVAFGTIALSVEIWNSTARPFLSVSRATSFSIGFLLSTVSKFAYYANNPAWPIMHDKNGGLNLPALVLGVVTALLVSRPQAGIGSAEANKSVHGKGSSVWAAAGVGGLIFSLQSLLSDSSTIIYWTWSGYPLKGPLPVPYGAVTIFAGLVGTYLGVTQKKFFSSWRAYVLAVASAVVFYVFEDWTAYVGGLLLTVYLLAIVPVIFEAASIHPPARTFGLAFLVYILLVLAHVWIVAYAFVPGGPLLRERTDIVLGSQVVFLGLGIYGGKQVRIVSNEKKSSINFIKLRSVTIVALTGLAALTAVIGFDRTNKDAPKPYHDKDTKLVTAGIWTIHFGLDNDMWASERRMRDVIGELEIDVIGLLESDTQRIIMGNRDVTQEIAEDLGYYVDYGPGPNKHTWGAALLSKFPILNSTHHLLPSPVGELAPAIHATLDVHGTPLDVVVFHSGQEEDVEDRRLQTAAVSKIMAGSSNPLILLSYLVTKPLEGNYNTYVSEETGMKDIDPSDWDRWCEYILYKNIRRVGYARVSRSTITDTEIQLGKFIVGKSESSNNRIQEDEVPKEYRFPALFRGDGVRGHRYHVFDEPRYFA
ncbi:Frag1/DRAM/Sfk1 family-domain-containing protein [Lipomyces japonicus]|uniref:Frag1/DRAM/Sfk1 family-domain-containing protein n=1 Tax=Lipomyces japonicus TaxID=56871 RepID=UPI0034CE6B03